MEGFIENLKVSLHRGFIDKKYAKTNRYAPQLLTNDTKQNKNVLTSLHDELNTCLRL